MAEHQTQWEHRRMMSEGYYFDRQGKPVIDVLAWARLHQDRAYKTVAFSELPNGRTVSTVWLGINHNFADDGPPIIFETMVFSAFGMSDDLDMDRYATEDEARAGHERMVQLWTLDHEPSEREPET